MNIYEAVRTFPSGHHNAPYTPELGHHWPEGQRFKMKPQNMQKHLQKRHGADRLYFDQIGGEEVTISVKVTELDSYLRPVNDAGDVSAILLAVISLVIGIMLIVIGYRLGQ